ncbi:MAG: putative membrane protein insertion efficiency factor [Chlamydiia bacterium]|nr:putative membrane protein insertion efficiency factor [Chlamydiia bacterium]
MVSRKFAKATILFVIAAHLFAPNIHAARAGFFHPWGKDGALSHPKRRKASKIDLPKNRSPLVYGMEKVVDFHQNVISPVDGPRSHFRPTSSRYMLLAMKRHGFIKGYLMGCDRLLRENTDPWVYRKREISGKVYKWDPTYRSY